MKKPLWTVLGVAFLLGLLALVINGIFQAGDLINETLIEDEAGRVAQDDVEVEHVDGVRVERIARPKKQPAAVASEVKPVVPVEEDVEVEVMEEVLEGPSVPEGKEAITLWAAVNEGDATSAEALIKMYHEGLTFGPKGGKLEAPDAIFPKLVQLYWMVTDSGNKEHVYNLANLMVEGYPYDRSGKKLTDPKALYPVVADLYWEAFGQGNMDAAVTLGGMILTGQGYDRRGNLIDTREEIYTEASKLLWKASEGGVPQATRALLDLYTKRIGYDEFGNPIKSAAHADKNISKLLWNNIELENFYPFEEWNLMEQLIAANRAYNYMGQKINIRGEGAADRMTSKLLWNELDKGRDWAILKVVMDVQNPQVDFYGLDSRKIKDLNDFSQKAFERYWRKANEGNLMAKYNLIGLMSMGGVAYDAAGKPIKSVEDRAKFVSKVGWELSGKEVDEAKVVLANLIVSGKGYDKAGRPISGEPANKLASQLLIEAQEEGVVNARTAYARVLFEGNGYDKLGNRINGEDADKLASLMLLEAMDKGDFVAKEAYRTKMREGRAYDRSGKKVKSS